MIRTEEWQNKKESNAEFFHGLNAQEMWQLHEQLTKELNEYFCDDKNISSEIVAAVCSYNPNWIIESIPKSIDTLASLNEVEACAYRLMALCNNPELRKYKDEIINNLYYSTSDRFSSKVYQFINANLENDDSLTDIRENIDSRTETDAVVPITLYGPNPFRSVEDERSQRLFEMYQLRVETIGKKLSSNSELSDEEKDLMRLILKDDNEYRAGKLWKQDFMKTNSETYQEIIERLVDLWKDEKMVLMLTYQIMVAINPGWTDSAWKNLGYDPDLGAFKKNI